jgi:carboxypeptidase Taq
MVDFFDEINDLADFRFNSLGLDEFYNQANTVRPTTSRMTSDEVSYGMHIIIRFELEKMLFEDQLTMKELPIAWNQKYDDYLGIEVPNDTVGVMQDLHWYSNYWGYFHGYFMGDLIGSQFHATMQDQVPDYAEELCGGNLAPVLSWLQENLFAKGNYYPALDHLEAITGSSLDTKYFKDYITKKYNPI